MPKPQNRECLRLSKGSSTSKDVHFHRLDPEYFAYLPQKLTDMLLKAVNKSPTSDFTLEDAVEYAKAGEGDFYAVMMERKAVGALFFLYGDTNRGRVLDVALLGGDNFNLWKAKFREFAINTAKSKACNVIWGIGRKGWLKIFPDAKPIGMVFELKIS